MRKKEEGKKMINKIKANKLLNQILKFVIVGGTATIIDYVVFFILHEILKTNILLSNVISFTLSLIYNYTISIIWVFDVDKKASKKQQFILFLIFSLIGLAINTSIVYICTDVFNIYSMIGKVVATAIVMVYNFITRKKFLERKE